MELPHIVGSASEKQRQMVHRVLASSRCRAILSLSDTARDLAKAKFDGLNLPEISRKIGTFRGGVIPSANEADAVRNDGGALRLIFVGANGFRKGLVPLLDAVEQLRTGGVDVELTVVSSIPEKSYAVPAARMTTLSASEIRSRMAASSWITHHSSLPYQEVRRRMSQHDLLVLPTLDETLGWVVIEAAMEGVASVASNAFALPELIDDGVTGRLLRLPLNEGLRWRGLFGEGRETAYDEAVAVLRNGLVEVLSEVAGDRSLAWRWGEAARSRMLGLYHPDVAAAELSGIYDGALG
jgi:starch synthase